MKKSPSESELPDGGGIIRPTRFEPSRPVRPARRALISVRTWVSLGFLAACALIAWFLFAAKAVYIQTTPPEAQTGVGTLLQFRLGDRYLLLSGEYDLLLRAEGYHNAHEKLRVGSDQDQHFRFELERLPGILHVNTVEVESAEVTLDGKPAGKAPVTIPDIPFGDHQVHVTAERYFPFEATVPIEGLGHEQTLKVELKPAWAEVTLASEPAGAEVLVDDESVGVTPITTEIMEGDHVVRVRARSFKEWHRELHVQAGEAQKFEDIQLEPAEAVVYLVTDPAGASTTVNGEYRGLTPLEVALTPGKTSTVRFFKQGYLRASRDIRAKSGDNERMTVSLQPELATVEIHVQPENAEIFVDGQSRGRGSQTLKLPTRAHRIEARLEGYVDFAVSVTPHPQFTQEVNILLQTEAEARRAALKPVIKTSQGQSLKLFRAGKFTMGASRREPGRRANETLLNVNLTRPFYLALKQVTNRGFRAFDSSHNSGQVQGHSLDGEEQPVVNITWDQAALYCNWLSQAESLPPFYHVEGGNVTGFNPSSTGYRLPTEAEWEWAARVREDGTMLKFPWGDQMPPVKGSGNYADEQASGIIGKVINKYDDGFIVTAPAGSFPANMNGLFDMGGNAAEWTHDFYTIEISNPDRTLTDPLGPERGEFHVIRGSSWAHGGLSELRLSFRDYGNKPRPDVSFRIARYLE